MAKRRTLAPEFKAQVVLEEFTGVKDKAEIRRDVGIDVCDEQGDAPRMIDSEVLLCAPPVGRGHGHRYGD